MDTMLSLLPELELDSGYLAVTDALGHRTRQRIEPSDLLAIVPENYEELLNSGRSCTDLQELLKIPTSTPWLYSVSKHRLVAEPLAPFVSVPQAADTDRISVDSTSTAVDSLGSSRQRSGSESSSSSVTLVEEWTHVVPPSVEPTHMLVVSSSIPVLPELRTPDNDSACVEVPINMLAVAFNCPNIKVSSLANVPRPQAGELPRLSLRLKSTEVVPQLLAYMHTKDQRHLFDCLVPDWMYQVIRPVAPTSGNSGRHKRSASITTVLKAVKAMTMRKGHGRTLSGSSLQDELLDSLVDQQSADDNGGEPGSIRSRLVRACPEGVDLCEALDDVAKNLFALGSNLEELGYCEPGLDEELVILSRTILAEFVRNAKVSPE